jgi:hypothetical protein
MSDSVLTIMGPQGRINRVLSFPPVVVVEAAGAKQNSALMESYDAFSDESEFILSARRKIRLAK